MSAEEFSTPETKQSSMSKRVVTGLLWIALITLPVSMFPLHNEVVLPFVEWLRGLVN